MKQTYMERVANHWKGWRRWCRAIDFAVFAGFGALAWGQPLYVSLGGLAIVVLANCLGYAEGVQVGEECERRRAKLETWGAFFQRDRADQWMREAVRMRDKYSEWHKEALLRHTDADVDRIVGERLAKAKRAWRKSA